MFEMFINKFLKTSLAAINVIKRCSSSTIFALSTNIKPMGSAIAVIRISGDRCFDLLSHLIRNTKTIEKCIGNPRKAFFVNLYDKESNEMLDSSLVICFGKPLSYTGEDMCELHIHGSNAVINGVLSVLSRIDGFRPSETGEFTRRALINNKMDLIQVEAINDLIQSQTHSQRRRALTAINGSVSQLYDNWRQDIIKLMANIEAIIDFGEEELIEQSVFDGLKSQMNGLMTTIATHLVKCKTKSDLIKDGIKVSIIGEPNVGKSSLINKLCERELAIVSPISGTTRDVIETWLNINGYSVSISDTAGIKHIDSHFEDLIEKEGINRAIKSAQNSDLILVVMDATTLIDNSNCDSLLNPFYLKHRENWSKNIIYIINKIDLLSQYQYNCLQQNCNKLLSHWCPISCKTSLGLQQLTSKLTQIVDQLCGNTINEMLFITVRHEAHLTQVVQQINQSVDALDKDIAISAHHLREAAQQLSYITGRITTEDVLDVIFRDFCIGK